MEIYKKEKRRKDKANTATIDKVLDPKTLKILDNLKKSNKLFNLQGTFSSGKEANVYTGECSTDLISKFIQNNNEEANCVIPVVLKIYKTSTMLFKDRIRYIIDEKRFSSFCISNSRKLIKVWAEKEIRNLKRMSKYGILCPKPLYFKRTILIMSMIGDEKPAPRLKDALIDDWPGVYRQCIDIIKRLYQTARLVHADFSEYNLIYYNGQIYVIDVGQSVETSHQNAHSFLSMDIKNINDFFEKRGVVVQKDIDIFEDITGLKIPDYLRDMKLSSESFIPTRITEVVNEEDYKNFCISSEDEESNKISSTEDQEDFSTEDQEDELNSIIYSTDEEVKSVDEEVKKDPTENINILVRKISIKNPEVTKEEEKIYNKQRKKIVKEMNRERRIMRVLKEQDVKIKRLNKRQSKKR